MSKRKADDQDVASDEDISIVAMPKSTASGANASSVGECAICCDEAVSSARLVTCALCRKQCCHACAKRMLLDKDKMDRYPTCLVTHGCTQSWTEVPKDQLGADFFTGPWRQHCKAVALAREQSRLPSAQPIAQAERMKAELAPKAEAMRKECREYREKFEHLRHQLRLYDDACRANTNKQRGTIVASREQPQWETLLEPWEVALARRRAMAAELDALLAGDADDSTSMASPTPAAAAAAAAAEKKKQPEPPKANFVLVCADAACHGFVSSADWRCGMCRKAVCSECRELKKDDEEHVCDPGTLASVRDLLRNSKPCPGKGCGEPIERIHGCDHMWCTRCKTSFNWQTLAIIKDSANSNPHLHQYQREHAIGVYAHAAAAAAPPAAAAATGCPQQQQREQPINWRDTHAVKRCMDLRDIYQGLMVQDATRVIMGESVASTLLRTLDYHRHLALVEFPRRLTDRKRRTSDDADRSDLVKLRVAYLCGELTEAQWANRISAYELDVEYAGELRDVLEVWLSTARTAYHRLADETPRPEHAVPVSLWHSPYMFAPYEWRDWKPSEEVRAAFRKRVDGFLAEMAELRQWCNAAMRRVSAAYGGRRAPVVNADLEVVAVGKNTSRKKAKTESETAAAAKKTKKTTTKKKKKNTIAAAAKPKVEPLSAAAATEEREDTTSDSEGESPSGGDDVEMADA